MLQLPGVKILYIGLSSVTAYLHLLMDLAALWPLCDGSFVCTTPCNSNVIHTSLKEYIYIYI